MIVGCLALNASFEPLTLVPMQRALRLVLDGKAEIVEADRSRPVRSERLTLPRPAVIRLTKFIHVPRRFRKQVTNTFLFARDHYRCQYCGRHMTEFKHREALTRDHLIPLSRGGTNDWTKVELPFNSGNRSNVSINCLFGGWGSVGLSGLVVVRARCGLEEGGQLQADRSTARRPRIDAGVRPLARFELGDLGRALGRGKEPAAQQTAGRPVGGGLPRPRQAAAGAVPAGRPRRLAAASRAMRAPRRGTRRSSERRA